MYLATAIPPSAPKPMESCFRVLLVTLPVQPQINPCLEFAKRLLKMGIEVTYVTTFSAINHMTRSTTPPPGLTFFGFNDGGTWGMDRIAQLMEERRRHGSEAVAKLITSKAETGQPFDHVVYTLFVPWAGQVAHDLQVPSTFIWIQPATILDIYHYYLNGYGDSIRENMNDPSWSIELPGLPPVTGGDLPTYLSPKNISDFALPLLKEHFDVLDAQANPKVLVNSFDALEPGALRAIEKLNLVAIGPLIPFAFLDGKDPSDNSFGGSLFEDSRAYINWLDSMPNKSVVYAAFGSYSPIAKQQIEEIERGLLACGRPFLWVVRATEDEKLSCKEKLEEQGMVVPWCSQVEVLSHPSVGCFLSHCGWNSSLEGLVTGVPIVAFPQWGDQVTNAKLIEDVWKTGTRVKPNLDHLVESDEIRRCIEVVMGGDEMKMNAKKWKDLAREAAKEGGSSAKNFKTFVDEIKASKAE